MLCLRALLLTACCLAPAALGLIHNLDSHPESEQIQPLAIEISPEEEGGHDLQRIARDVLGQNYFAYRDERQVGSGDPGLDLATTTRLDGTSRHYFALVHWTGHPSEVLFIVTMTRRENPTDSCLWRSTNYGKTFSNDTYKLNDSRVVIQWYYVSPEENYLIFADVLQDKIFVTQDEGETFIGYDLNFTPNKIKFQGRLVPNVLEGDLPKHVLGYDEDRQELHVSRDLGETWTQLGSNVSNYAWRVLGPEYEPNTTVYYEQNINETHAELMFIVDPYEKADRFDPYLGEIAIGSTVWAREFILVQKPINWTVQEEYSSPLWVSTFRQPFRQAQFPLKSQEEHYAVMDASENQVFMAVYHSEEITNLYISDKAGVKYSLSLEDIVGPRDWEDNRPDFGIHLVEGLTGVYLVNRYNRLVDENGTTTEAPVSTVISYDKGGEWSTLAAPAVDRNNVATLCQPPLCSLHLRMKSDAVLGYTAVLSQDSAIGLILAQGNIGSSLVSNDSLLRMYLSRDGGFSWQEIEAGHWSFQLVGLGSIIVMIPKRATVDPVNYVLWSCNEGATFQHYNFTDTPIRLVGMLLEKKEKSRHLTIFGYFLRRRFAWLIIDLNFTDAVPSQCSHPDDYFTWVPSDGRPDGRCLLGSKLTYERRRSDVCCYINPDYERPISLASCPCAREDYECDFGFEQKSLNGLCVPMDDIAFPPPPPQPQDCPEGTTYTTTQGYRKVVGDNCTVQTMSPYAPVDKPCPAVPPDGLVIKITEDITSGVSAKQELNFTLTQDKGWTVFTEYTWDFGDGNIVSGVGLSNVMSQSHAYEKDGSYVVKVTASNSAGRSLASLVIQVGDNAGAARSSGDSSKATKLGLEVGVSLFVLVIAALVIFIVGIVWWYRKRFHTLQIRYRSLQAGAVPMTLADGDFQEDFGYGKEDGEDGGEDDDDERILVGIGDSKDEA